MIVRLRDGTEFFATKEQADQLWQYKVNGQPWVFQDYRGDASAILIIKPGGYPPPAPKERRIEPPKPHEFDPNGKGYKAFLEARKNFKLGSKA
jgi:hypothetical protein